MNKDEILKELEVNERMQFNKITIIDNNKKYIFHRIYFTIEDNDLIIEDKNSFNMSFDINSMENIESYTSYNFNSLDIILKK